MSLSLSLSFCLSPSLAGDIGDDDDSDDIDDVGDDGDGGDDDDYLPACLSVCLHRVEYITCFLWGPYLPEQHHIFICLHVARIQNVCF